MINNYVQHNPNRIIFGKDSEKQVANEIIALGCTKVLLHFDDGDFILPLVNHISEMLEMVDIKCYRLGGVKPNPKVSLMKEGCKIVKDNNIDFILAIGGGSTMDSAKYIACGTYYDGDIWYHEKFKPISTTVIKHGVVVTMPGTGSEVSTAAVWRDDTIEPNKKTCVFAKEMRFDFAIINPTFTFTLPNFQTAAGCFDIISHSIEDYFCAPESSEFYLATYEAIINDVIKNVRIVLKQPYNYTARANISRVAYVPLNDVISCGAQRGYSFHNIEKPMTGLYHRTHGEMLAIIVPAWMKYNFKKNIPLFTRLAVNCFNAKMDYENHESTIQEGINNLENFLTEIGLPTRLKQIGIDDSNFDVCANMAIDTAKNDYVGLGIKLTKQEIISTYKLAL